MISSRSGVVTWLPPIDRGLKRFHGQKIGPGVDLGCVATATRFPILLWPVIGDPILGPRANERP
jgi:hypothetical protein